MDSKYGGLWELFFFAETLHHHSCTANFICIFKSKYACGRKWKFIGIFNEIWERKRISYHSRLFVMMIERNVLSTEILLIGSLVLSSMLSKDFFIISINVFTYWNPPPPLQIFFYLKLKRFENEALSSMHFLIFSWYIVYPSHRFDVIFCKFFPSFFEYKFFCH